MGFEPMRTCAQWILSPPPYPLGQTDCCLQIASAGHQLGQSKEQRLEIGEVSRVGLHCQEFWWGSSAPRAVLQC